MNRRAITVANILTYSGTPPLIASAITLYFPLVGFDTALIARTYSAIIISFLCGIHWAAYLLLADQCTHNLLITSSIVALIAWGSLLATNQLIATLFKALCFLYLLALDLKRRDVGILPDWFYRLSPNATIIVMLCLSATLGLA